MRTKCHDDRAALLSWFLKIDEAKAAEALELIDSTGVPDSLLEKTESPLERLFLVEMIRFGEIDASSF